MTTAEILLARVRDTGARLALLTSHPSLASAEEWIVCGSPDIDDLDYPVYHRYPVHNGHGTEGKLLIVWSKYDPPFAYITLNHYGNSVHIPAVIADDVLPYSVLEIDYSISASSVAEVCDPMDRPVL